MESNYLQPLFDYVWKFISVDETTRNLIIQHAEVKQLKKGDILLKEGQICHHLYFSIAGFARSFHYHGDKEITYWIYPERGFFTSWSSFLQQKPSFETIEALEDIDLIQIKYDDLQNIFEASPAMERMFRLVLENYITTMEEFSKSYQFLTAKEKYELIQSYMPDLVHRVNLGHIASMLGISQETLSRVRSK